MSKIIEFPDQTRMSPRQRQLSELYDASAQILKLGEKGQWKQALSEQRDRRQKMDDFFAVPTSVEEGPLVKEVIEAILQLDQRVAAMLYQQRSELLEDFGQVRRNNTKLGDYISNS